MLVQQDESSTCLQNLYAGRAAFLICGGPSLTSHDPSLITQRGVLTCAVNNAAVIHRPQLWVSVDDPGNFCDAIWRDPGIWKFVPQDHFYKPLVVRDEHDQLIVSEEKVRDMPAVFGYQRNEVFSPSDWLHEPTFNWGNHSSRRDENGNKGSRSVMYVALKLLYYLGVRRVYLIGCDFRMEEGQQNYAFEQDRTARSVRGNNSSYRILNARLERLKPEFDKASFEVFNCTPNSGLTVFPFMDYEEAIADCTRMMPRRISTAGMYDRLQRERDARRKAERSANVEQARNNYKAASSGMAIPPLTLVTTVTARTLPILKWTWQTWMQFRPWLHDVPKIFICDENLGEGNADLDELCLGQDVRRLTWKLGGNPQGLHYTEAVTNIPAEHVKTPWYLLLDPTARATPFGNGISEDWFLPPPVGALPVFISHAWGYTKPACALEQLEEWAAEVPALCRFPRLNIKYDPEADRVRHEAISSWCFFAQTDWARRVVPMLDRMPPWLAFDTLMFYLAARWRVPIVRTNLKAIGWDHCFCKQQRIIERCQVLLEKKAEVPVLSH